jgi:hypothetical protein
MRDFFATILALAIIFGTTWGAIALFVVSVDLLSTTGVPSELLYFSGGVVFANVYKRITAGFTDYCNTVLETLYKWIVW